MVHAGGTMTISLITKCVSKEKPVAELSVGFLSCRACCRVVTALQNVEREAVKLTLPLHLHHAALASLPRSGRETSKQAVGYDMACPQSRRSSTRTRSKMPDPTIIQAAIDSSLCKTAAAELKDSVAIKEQNQYAKLELTATCADIAREAHKVSYTPV